MKPAINLPGLEEESSTLSMPSSLSSSSILDSPQSFIDSNFTLSKSFDPFDYTYLNNLIPISTANTATKSTSSTTCNSIPPSLWTKQHGGFSYSTINGGGDMHDQDDEEDYADTDDHYPPHFLIDLDLLDDNAMDSTTMAIHSELESPLPTCPANKCRVGAPSPVGLGAGPGPGPGATSSMINHHLLHLPYLFISTSSSSSSSSTSSVTAAVNIWSNNYYRYHDPFDDDEFDPTQPASLTLSSSDISTTSPQFTTTFAQPSSTMTAIDMLMELFPHYTQQQLILTLSKANYDMDRFLELVSSGDSGAVSSLSYSKKRQVCRHFLSGDCHRQGCRFAHDISIKVCKFWLQGGCLKGPQCEFAHSLEPICIRSPNATPTRSTKSSSGAKSTSSKNKNKSSSSTTTTDKSCNGDIQHHHCFTLNGNIFIDGSKQRRRGRKKIKRKSSTHANDDTPATVSTTNNNNDIRHASSFVDYPLDEDFPTLLSSSKSAANSSSTTTTGVCPLRVPTLSSTNFAQVVARSKMK